MSKLDNDTVDALTLKLSGLIGVFDLIVNLSSRDTGYRDNVTMLDFAFYISGELKDLHKTIVGFDYNS